jgi:hypothetical protein
VSDRHLVNMQIAPVQDGKYQATLKLDNDQTATSHPFETTDAASEWAVKYAEEAGKAADEDHSPEVKAGLASEAKTAEKQETTE